MDDPRYPVGKFEAPAEVSVADRLRLIEQVEEAPACLRAAVQGLAPAQLDTPYREGGWTVRQVVHHIPDSHLNAYVRFRWALTEEEPTIKPYAEERWAELPDARTAPPELSLALMDAVHRRWVVLLRAMTDGQWERTFRHPEMGVLRLDRSLALYAWHGRHHVGHITGMRQRMGWS
jgi:uncharacterized damage-inducible protein DinB